jgi:hypothetical protein
MLLCQSSLEFLLELMIGSYRAFDYKYTHMVWRGVANFVVKEVTE